MDNQGSLNAQKTPQVTMDNETPTVGAITMSVNLIRHKTNDTPVRSILAEILHSLLDFHNPFMNTLRTILITILVIIYI